MVNAVLRARTGHERSYQTPLVAALGEQVVVVRRDADAPAWLWCEHVRSGRAGWTPEAFLEQSDDASVGRLRRDYSAMELTVAVGEVVRAFETVAGWTWCVNADGLGGWLPDWKLEPESDA